MVDPITIPHGLITPRLILGVQPAVWFVLFLGVVLPCVAFGWLGLVALPVVSGVAAALAYYAHDDPDVLRAWLSDLMLAARYE